MIANMHDVAQTHNYRGERFISTPRSTETPWNPFPRESNSMERGM